MFVYLVLRQVGLRLPVALLSCFRGRRVIDALLHLVEGMRCLSHLDGADFGKRFGQDNIDKIRNYK